jgi:magnesium transporter
LDKTKNNRINWININGLFDTDVVKSIGEKFELDNLILEDILNTQHQPKSELTNDSVFITMKMLSVVDGFINVEHISFVLKDNYLFSFQETHGDVFDWIRERLSNGKSKVRKKSKDYLLYLLIDAIVDNYFVVLDFINDKVDEIEEQIYFNPTTEFFEQIIGLKKKIIYLRKSILPLENAIKNLIDDDSGQISDENHKYYSDILDHLRSLIQDIEILREIIKGQIELYMTSLSVKMNNVMKTLTIIASIFIPLTFVAGVYGMNFKFMPELEWYWGYPAILSVMALLGISMFIYMKRKHWF